MPLNLSKPPPPDKKEVAVAINHGKPQCRMRTMPPKDTAAYSVYGDVFLQKVRCEETSRDTPSFTWLVFVIFCSQICPCVTQGFHSRQAHRFIALPVPNAQFHLDETLFERPTFLANLTNHRTQFRCPFIIPLRKWCPTKI